jgi:hypothetical protein
MIRENIEAVNAALAKRQASFDAGRLVELDGTAQAHTGNES